MAILPVHAQDGPAAVRAGASGCTRGTAVWPRRHAAAGDCARTAVAGSRATVEPGFGGRLTAGPRQETH
eukprot:2224261-Prymnesium_polylepis.1